MDDAYHKEDALLLALENEKLEEINKELFEACQEISHFCDDNIFQTPLIQKYINKCNKAMDKAKGV